MKPMRIRKIEVVQKPPINEWYEYLYRQINR